MNISQSLMDRFFQNKCSSEEAAAVIEFLKNNPEKIQPFIKKEEWDAIESTASLPGNLSEEMLDNIKRSLFSDRDTEEKHGLKRINIKWVAAASVILLAGLWIYNTINLSTRNNDTAIQRSMDDSVTAAGSGIDKNNWKTTFNKGNAPLEVLLHDGSSVSLWAHSSIRYPDSFTNNKRDIYLEGQAFFKVAKDKSRPFTVFAGNLSTTALGTSFIVSAVRQKQYDIQVKLFTGKVVVRSAKKMTGWNKDIYLLPGQQLNYQELNAAVDVSSFISAKTKNMRAENTSAISNEELLFSNTALVEVLNRLNELKGVNIQYAKDQLTGMNFTGTINKKDDIGTVLKVIAQMNGLEIQPLGNNSFVVIKPGK